MNIIKLPIHSWNFAIKLYLLSYFYLWNLGLHIAQQKNVDREKTKNEFSQKEWEKRDT